MLLKRTLSCCFLLSLAALPALAEKEGAKAEPGKAEAGKGEPAMSKQEQAMMEAWQKAGTPGEQHKRLSDMAGSFDTLTRVWMKPGAPPSESKGRSENKVIWDGRFLQQEFKGDMMGAPFTGIGVTGYDNAKKKFVGTWMDSMSTSLAYMEGTMDPTGKVLTMTMEVTDPMTGKKMKNRTITKIEGPDRHVFEMYERGPGGKEYKGMEIVYTRAAAPAKAAPGKAAPARPAAAPGKAQ